MEENFVVTDKKQREVKTEPERERVGNKSIFF